MYIYIYIQIYIYDICVFNISILKSFNKLYHKKRTESSKVWFITKNKLKAVYKTICVRGSPPEVFFRKMFCKHEATPTRATMQKSDLNKNMISSSRRTPLGTIFVCQKSFERLKLFTVIKKNLFTRKISFVLPFFLLHFQVLY